MTSTDSLSVSNPSPASAPARSPTTPRERRRFGPGDLVAGRYRIEARLDEGGMAEVFRAVDETTREPCALKVLHASLGEHEDIRALFAREARVGEVIGPCPHVVEVRDAGLDDASALPFIVMELLEGETLEHRIARGPLPAPAVLGILEQVAAALDQAHAHGVIHRDLKPSNVFLLGRDDAAPTIKVMDFGIAKVLEHGALRTATQIGTPAYTAPEQMGATTRRLAARHGITIARGVSPETDVWALGLLAYEMFTGALPGHYWRFETLAELPMTIAFEEFVSASARAGDRAALLPEGFDAWFACCLQKDARARWSSAGAAVRALENQRSREGMNLTAPLRGPGIGLSTIKAAPPFHGEATTRDAEPPLAATKTARPRRTSRRLGSAFALGMSALSLVALGLWLRARNRAEPTAETATSLREACGVEPFDETNPLERRQWLADLRAGGPVAIRDTARACAHLAVLYERGEGDVTKDGDAASALYERACSASKGTAETPAVSEGCLALGRRREAAGEREAARRFFRAACDGNDPQGCVALGKLLTGAGARDDRTTEATADGKEARASFERACSANDAEGCTQLGHFVASGRGGAVRDEARAVTLYDRACQANHATGCVALGGLVAAGRGGLARDTVRAAELYLRACDTGENDGCARYAEMLARGDGGLRRDEGRALELARAACAKGSALGCVVLGRLELRGSSALAPDPREAETHFQRACDQGDGEGCSELGELELLRPSPSPARLEDVFRRGCESDAASACLRLGHLFDGGPRGMSHDAARAATAYERACDAGLARGCTDLANLLYLGEGGVTRDVKRSAELNERACRAGDPVGCARLGILCALGEGTARDLPRANTLFRDACRTPAPEDKSRCDTLAKLLTREASDPVERP